MAGDPTKEITKFVWSLGNYDEVAKRTLPAALTLADAAGIAEGDDVLDVATGSGNVAILAAQKGARANGCDLTPTMLDLARARAEREGLDVEFLEGDAEDLPYDDNSFDRVLSVFGAMFAPRPEVAAAEMFRVAKPGGVVGMANWTPEGLIGKQTQIMISYAPVPPPETEATSWGTDDAVAQRFGPHADAIETSRLFVREEYDAWDALVAHYENDLGPAVAMKQFLEPERYTEMFERLHALYESHNQANDGRIVVDSEYLQVIARKPS